jgi:hypothetical protein
MVDFGKESGPYEDFCGKKIFLGAHNMGVPEIFIFQKE